ncbi:hypothetical protein AGROH133_07020 [Agrobacterium tumefaciens]|nr:hypothetical protein AGROH133_07020 [Agrobacterium tumefaciens]
MVVHPQSVVVFSADVVSAGATERVAIRGLQRAAIIRPVGQKMQLQY